AKDLLLDGLDKGLIHWCCDLEVRGDFNAYPMLQITFGVANGHPFFWRRDERTRIELNCEANRATWAGPLIGFRSDGMGNQGPIFDPYASTELIASRVRFHNGDVVNYLVKLGLMPRPAPAMPVPNPVPAELASTSVTPVETGSAIFFKAAKGPKQRVVAEYACILFPDGKIPPDVGASNLHRSIARQQAKEAAAKNEKPPEPPSEDTCGRFLKNYRDLNT